jgi:hypothetical protein
MFNKNTKIFIGAMLIVIGGIMLISAYTKKQMLKETFEHYDNDINGTNGIEITNEK